MGFAENSGFFYLINFQFFYLVSLFFGSKAATTKINAKPIPANNKISETLSSPRSLNRKLNRIITTDKITIPTELTTELSPITNHN